MKNTAVIACLTIAEAPQPPVSSWMAFCVVCKAELWVSVPMYPHVESGEMEPICNKEACLNVKAAKAGEALTAELHPDQRAELAALGILDYAEEFVAEFNRNREDPS